MRRILSIFAGAMLLTGLLASPVSAASYGACQNDTPQNNTSGDQSGGSGAYGAESTVYIPASASFHLCTGTHDEDAVVANVGVKDVGNNGLIYVLLVRCNAGYYAFCDGSVHIVVEVNQGLPFIGHYLYDYGIAPGSALGTSYDLKVQWSSGETWNTYFNGSLLTSVTVHLMSPTNSALHARWFGETWDNADGLGNNVSGQSLNFGNNKVKTSSTTWLLRNTPTTPPLSDAQIHYVKNGSYGFYNYTVN